MFYLLFVSVIWAFSFGLIKKLSGLDPTAIGVLRIAFSAAVFIPLLRTKGLSRSDRVQLMLVGAVQFGIMYLLYQRSFLYLRSYEVALFTLTTPLFLILFDATLERRIERLHWLAALLSVVGAGVVVWTSLHDAPVLTGLFLLQAANACFAGGQLAYRRIRRRMTTPPDFAVFGWLYAGALVATTAASLVWNAWTTFHPTGTQWAVLVYLGVLSSGLCFFWWNRGATLVNAGVLAAMNNAKVPLGVACSLLFFHESANAMRLLIGGGLLCMGVVLAQRAEQSARVSR